MSSGISKPSSTAIFIRSFSCSGWFATSRGSSRLRMAGRTSAGLKNGKSRRRRKACGPWKTCGPGWRKPLQPSAQGSSRTSPTRPCAQNSAPGNLSTQDFYRQILRIIYRMLFLFVAEDRGLLAPASSRRRDRQGSDQKQPDGPAAVQRHSIPSAVCAALTLHRAGTPHPDLWQVFQLVTQQAWFR